MLRTMCPKCKQPIALPIPRTSTPSPGPVSTSTTKEDSSALSRIEELETKLERHREFIKRVHSAYLYTAPEVMHAKITDLVEGWEVGSDGNVPPLPDEDEGEDEDDGVVESVRDNGEPNC